MTLGCGSAKSLEKGRLGEAHYARSTPYTEHNPKRGRKFRERQMFHQGGDGDLHLKKLKGV